MIGTRHGLEVPCSVIVEMITDYLENTMPDDQRKIVEEHLAGCPPCERYIAQIRTTIALLGMVPDDTLSEPAWIELRLAFRAS